MSYSFFGTCFEDSNLLKDCLLSIHNQTIKPNEIILIDSSKSDRILKYLNEIFKLEKTKIIYKNINLPRVKALNFAISLSNSDFLIRFDSRTRFSKNYAELTLEIFNDKNKINFSLAVIGGRQNALPANPSLNAKLAAEIMNRSYIFGNPLYRRNDYNGKVNSIYLGCFPRKILLETPYREEVSLISEDSQICYDIISKGYNIYIFQDLKLNYLCRDNLISVIKLFRQYGRCRARTILSTKTIHDKKKFILILILTIILPFLTFIFCAGNVFFGVILIFILPLIYDFYHELRNHGFKKIFYIPFIALVSQISWGLGLLETLALYKLFKNDKSNFVK